MRYYLFRYIILLIFSLFFSWNNYCVAKTIKPKSVDYLLKKVSKAQNSLLKNELLAEISNKYSAVKDFKKAKLYADTILIDAKKRNNAVAFGYYYHAIAEIENAKLNYPEAQKQYLKASNYFYKSRDFKNFVISRLGYDTIFSTSNEYQKTIKNLLITYKVTQQKIPNEYSIIGDVVRKIAYSQLRINQIDFALKNTNISNKLFQKANNYGGIAKNYYQIALIHSKFGNLQKTKEYGEKALETIYNHHIDDKITVLLANLIISNVYKQQGNFSNAEEHVLKSLKIIEENNLIDYYRYAYLYLASIYYENNDLNKSIQYSNLAIPCLASDPINLVNAYFLKAKIYLREQKYTKAKIYFDKSISFLENGKYNKLVPIDAYEIYKLASKNEFQLKNYKQAFLFNEKYAEKSIAVLENEKDKRIQELLTKFEVEEINKVILKKEVEIQKEKYISKSILTTSGFILLSLIIISFHYLKLKAKNKEIANKNLALESQNLLASSLQQKEILLREIHHRVKNNLQLIISLFNIQARKNNYKTIEEFLEKGANRIKSMSLIHESLYQSNFFHQVDVKNYIISLCNSIKKSYSTQVHSKITILIEVESMFLNIDTVLPLGLLINEIITNSYKYAFPSSRHGTILIKMCSTGKNQYELIVADDGVGFNPENLTQKSFGLQLIRLLIRQLNGKFEVDSKNKTQYTINFSELKSKI